MTARRDPHSGFDGLPMRGITVIKVQDPPVDPLLVRLVARGIFNRTAPEDMFTLPSSLGSITMLIEDLRHARARLVESRTYAKNLFSTLINGLAADPYKECSQIYRELVAQLKEGGASRRNRRHRRGSEDQLCRHHRAYRSCARRYFQGIWCRIEC